VECHKQPDVRASLEGWRQDNYAKWVGSIHGVKGITCDKCKGGNPNQSIKELAHIGVKKSTDPSSPIYYTRIPETCGACHQEVYEWFVQSKHFQNLYGHRLAPDCTTCHGSHSISPVSPMAISEACKFCHNKLTGIKPNVPKEAKEALMLISQAEEAITKARIAVEIAKEQGKDMGRAEKDIREAESKLEKSRSMWHAFNIGDFRKNLLEAMSLASKANSTARRLPETPWPERSICGATVLLLLASTPLAARFLKKLH
jgi:hypothetical protein